MLGLAVTRTGLVPAPRDVLVPAVFMPLADAGERIPAGAARDDGRVVELLVKQPERIGQNLLVGERNGLGGAGQVNKRGMACLGRGRIVAA